MTQSPIIVAAVDFETTGLDHEQDEITEIGVVLFDARPGAVIEACSSLRYTNRPISDGVEAITTGITADLLDAYGYPVVRDEPSPAEALLRDPRITHYCAHHADFERAFGGPRRLFLDRPWIDTQTDLPLPPHFKSANLTMMAAQHGFLNPLPHRALTDALTSVMLLGRYPIDQVLARAASPVVKVIAHVNYDDRQLAKGLRFNWDGDSKTWWREFKQCDLPSNSAFPFPVTVTASAQALSDTIPESLARERQWVREQNEAARAAASGLPVGKAHRAVRGEAF